MGKSPPRRWHPVPEPSAASRPHIQITCLTIFLLLLIGCLHGDLVVVQEPSFISGLKGQSVTLYCSYTSDGEDVFRSVVYWAFKEGKAPTVIHPAPPPRYQNRVKFSKYNGSVNTTFQIHPLQLKDTETYYCYISFLVGEQTFTKEGAGTRLFVHEPLVLTPPPNCSCDAPQRRYVSCGTRVPVGDVARIDWLRNGEEVRRENRTQLVKPAGDGSARLESQVPLPVPSPGTEVNYTCMLTHTSGGIIDWRQYIAVSESPGHPVLLYVLLIVNSTIILLLVMAVGLKKPSVCSRC
ncbi:immunoglobulin lambda-1 light chain-like [Scyliorhinus canicula]|uniref:immunoglobulin lambda-1 light chain-like n=1 Tax=Scyliorhinus canicula TaxID=7830 RepID=UPI0018F3DB89|nr:immunoglobulin lambda-1 light chain-like [Scyliorhinus canicula]